MGWTVQGSNPRGGKIFHIIPDRPWAYPASYTMGTGSSSGVKRLGSGVGHPPPSSAEVKERVQLYLYSLFGPLWPVLRVSFTFTVIGDITTVSTIQSEAG